MPIRFAATNRLAVFAATFVSLCSMSAILGQELSPIKRKIPPIGIELPAERIDGLRLSLAKVEADASDVKNDSHWPDVDCLLKAVRFALIHNEFYKPEHVDWAHTLLDIAAARVESMRNGETPWRSSTGRVVRGYRSSIDDSSQPYGLELPESWRERPAKSVPLYVWLHGRGDKTTDLHFIHQRLNKAGTIKVDDAIIVHPFGRHCIGFKSAGEVDVIECVTHVMQEYPVDPDRVVLMGFSMGGAGAWHLGAHYTDRWVAVSPGAGFAETAEYNRLKAADFPPHYEQQLWGLYDVPAYARNLFNVPVIAYSGEKDKQIQAARVMERVFQTHGQTLNHLIGPGMGHKYHPDTLATILKQLDQAVSVGRNPSAPHVQLETRTLRYNRMHWVKLLRLEQHWQPSSIEARLVDEELEVSTEGVRAFELDYEMLGQQPKLVLIDNQRMTTDKNRFVKDEQGRWSAGDLRAENHAKRPGLQGPIDDLFMEPFLVVLPSGQARHDKVQAWVEFEIAHLQQRWKALFRGELRIKQDVDVTAEDLQRFHLLLWGTPAANRIISRINDELPIRWLGDDVVVGGDKFAANEFVPAFICPNPLNPHRYILLNSGPTFREGHDRTNSLQNPKLPDWVVFDLKQPPDAFRAAQPAAAGFFDEQWKLDPHTP